MAWIGIADPVSKRVVPAASYGDVSGYLDQITVVAADVPEGRGPTGSAVFQGKYRICSDIEQDPVMKPWRDTALSHAFRASAAFPLRSGREVIGAFTVYGDQPRSFTNEEIALLSSLADDVSYAIDSLANEERRKKAEEQTRVTNALLKLFAQKYSRKEYLDAACELIREWSGVRHVGIRLANSDGNVPFESCRGYTDAFLKVESTLSLLTDPCICMRVIAGTPAPAERSSMTPSGSFLSRDTEKFVGELTDEERKQYRGDCMRFGFQSLAVIPIRYRENPIGAIHLADERTGLLAQETVVFLEQLAYIIGEAIFRFGIEDDLRQNHERLTATNAELRNLQAHVEAVREGERAHIAREVHDQLGQAMTALKMDIAWLNKKHPSRNAEVRERSAEMLALVDGAIQSVKRITAELRPSVLDDFGLQAAIEWTAQEFEKRSGVRCRVLSRPVSITMDRTRSTVIYRVLQESLTNVARHAKAKTVIVSLDLEGERFRMTVRDDGKGIPAEKVSDPASYGLIGMRERVRFLGGDISISGTRGGTTIAVSIPLSGVDGPLVGADGAGPAAAGTAGKEEEARP
jgi:signal transduction histidine kinase